MDKDVAEGMGKEALMRAIQKWPDHIFEAEREYLDLLEDLEEKKMILKMAEAQVLLQEDGPITGKNQEMREAQLLRYTGSERVLVKVAQAKADRQLAELSRQRNHLAACIALTRLVE